MPQNLYQFFKSPLVGHGKAGDLPEEVEFPVLDTGSNPSSFTHQGLGKVTAIYNLLQRMKKRKGCRFVCNLQR